MQDHPVKRCNLVASISSLLILKVLQIHSMYIYVQPDEYIALDKKKKFSPLKNSEINEVLSII